MEIQNLGSKWGVRGLGMQNKSDDNYRLTDMNCLVVFHGPKFEALYGRHFRDLDLPQMGPQRPDLAEN